MTELANATSATKRYGQFVAVDGVDLHVEPGEIVGLIGANGAGKTTLIRMLLGLTATSAGDVAVFGEAPSRQTRRRLGYVPQGLGLWPDLTALENIAFTAAAFGVAPRLDALPAGVDPDDLVGALSLGQQRQLAFVCALAHEPDLVVLDEPTSGVDPLARAHLWERIHRVADDGGGVLVTTHYMQEAQQCDRLVVMSAGRVAARGRLNDVLDGVEAIEVDSADWRAAFAVLAESSIPIMLTGRRVRAVGVERATVEQVLSAADVAAAIDVVPGTLEEAMLLIERAG
ncbi:MAG: ABC transporter ATP-binding protein [Actinomycetota bacterium]